MNVCILVLAALFQASAGTERVRSLWIEQKLDHFNDSDTRTWKMRYMVNDDFLVRGSPIFISVGGEWVIHQSGLESGHFYDMAKKYRAVLYYTQHRYYGDSKPTKDLSTPNLKYLNVHQALADLAHFIRHQKATVPGLARSKVIIMGCSYAGAMTVWFKREYPDLVTGVWAISAPLYYKLDFSDYLTNTAKSIALAGGQACYDRIYKAAYEFYHLNDSAVISDLKRQNYYEVLEEMEDEMASLVQFNSGGKIREFCKKLLAGQDSIVTMARLMIEIKVPAPREVDYILGNTSYSQSIGRQWLYQVCNEFGNFQTTSSSHQPFGNHAPLFAMASECKNVFGPRFTLDYISQQVEQINTYFGAYEPNVNDIYYSHGQLDPWRTAGIHDPAHATTIPDVSHCGDTHSIRPSDNAELRASKERISKLVGIWLNETGRIF